MVELNGPEESVLGMVLNAVNDAISKDAETGDFVEVV